MTRPELRAALRRIYGPGRFRIGPDGTVVVRLPERSVLGCIGDPRLDAEVAAMLKATGGAR